jgi:hypothetical protein
MLWEGIWVTLLTFLAALGRACCYSDACLTIAGEREDFNGIFVTCIKPIP